MQDFLVTLKQPAWTLAGADRRTPAETFLANERARIAAFVGSPIT
jgi:hypothetical protein